MERGGSRSLIQMVDLPGGLSERDWQSYPEDNHNLSLNPVTGFGETVIHGADELGVERNPTVAFFCAFRGTGLQPF